MTDIQATSQKQVNRRAAKTDQFLNALLTRDPGDIETWIDNNVSTQQQLHTLVKKLSVIVSILAQEVYQ